MAIAFYRDDTRTQVEAATLLLEGVSVYFGNLLGQYTSRSRTVKEF